MLSSLPPELLRDIIEATVPHTFHSRTYRTRQRTLCSVSLVSKLFHSIAQPLLLQIVYVKYLMQLKSSTPDVDDGGGGTRIFNGARCVVLEGKDSSEFETLLPELCSVAALTLLGLGANRLEISLPSSLGHLSSLHLTYCRVVNVGPILLPNLRSLTLIYVDAATKAALLDALSLPRLEELAWYDEPATIDNVIVHSSFRQLLPQIEVLVLDLQVLKTLADAEVRSAASRTLVDCSCYHLSDLSKSTHQPVHLRVYGLTTLDKAHRLTTFSEETADMIKYIESNPSLPLRSVYLVCDDPSTVHLSSTSPDYVEGLARVYRQRKIDLIFEIGPNDLSVDPCFSPNFSRRMKEQRRKETVS